MTDKTSSACPPGFRFRHSDDAAAVLLSADATVSSFARGNGTGGAEILVHVQPIGGRQVLRVWRRMREDENFNDWGWREFTDVTGKDVEEIKQIMLTLLYLGELQIGVEGDVNG
jgi:hypothetical protein